MEAATVGTPSVALRVGGLAESIEDGVTGFVADDPAGLTDAVRRLVDDGELRESMGAAARARAASFTWERAARQTLDCLESAAAEPVVGVRAAIARAETMKAVGMAAATLAVNALGLLFTVLFARILGATDYGSLAALVSTFLILAVPGSALQVAVARETALGHLGSGAELAATLAAWRLRLWAFGLALTLAALLLREPLSDLISVPETWAAAATLPTGFIWLLLSFERGALQGLHAYKPVAWSLVLENLGRLVLGLVMVAAGLGVTGAYLGTPLSMLAVAIGLRTITTRRLAGATAGAAVSVPRLRSLIGNAWPAVVGLFLVAVLQNVDVIMVKRQIGGDAAGAYAAAAVAAKAVIWVAIGIGLYLLPEATRASRTGGDPRKVLVRALGIVAAVAVPMLIVYALVPKIVLRLAFGEQTVQASGALLVLGCAMTLLAVAYLGVQYMLALGRLSFLWALGLVAAAEIAVLSGAGLRTLGDFAGVVLVLQAVAAACVLTLGFARRSAVPTTGG
jgi:O-antigen/teichoic acid export membrane protein